ncbi:MAG: hypothetical protein ACE5EP_04450 [Candidatus Methylomirabilales bacterium]
MVLERPGERSSTPVAGLLEAVREEYARALGCPIHIYAPASHFSPPRWGGGLHLHLFALPARSPWLTIWPVTPSVEIPTVFSWPLADGTTQALNPRSSLSQGVLKCDERGHAIAGTLGENIYVFFDLLRQAEELGAIMLRRILDMSFEGLTEVLSHGTGRPPHHLEVSLHRLKYSTTLATLDHPSARPRPPATADSHHRDAGEDGDSLHREMTGLEENLKELSRQMVSQTRLLRDCRHRLRTLEKAEQSEEALVREFDGLLGIPEVRDVQVLEDRLCVFTDTVDTVVASKRYRLGRFRVDIRFNGEVTIKNLTRAYGYYDHPHIWNAKPCLGNIGQSVLKLISEFQLVATVHVLLEYLKTVNPKGWYAPIDHWEELRA